MALCCRRVLVKHIILFDYGVCMVQPCCLKEQVRFSSSKQVSHSEYCVNTVRKYDYENFLSTLLLPKESRTSVFALRAWNVELAQVPDIVSEKHIGLMRYQFWKESLDLIFQGSPRQTPVAIELTRAARRHNLTKRWFNRIIDARIEGMSNRAHFNMQEVESTAENTVSSLNYLILETLGIRDVNADHAASHMGKAQGIVTLLRGTPHNASKGHCFLPTELLMMHNISQEQIIRGTVTQELKDLIYEIASSAHQHLQLARKMKDKVPSEAYIAFLPMVATEAYLTSLQQSDFNIFDGRLQQRNHWLPFRLWRQKLKKTY